MSAAGAHIDALLVRLEDGHALDEDAARQAMDDILDGKLDHDRMAALLVALRARPVTADELVGFARSMRAHALRVDAQGPLLDTCGTGGAPVKTFNISTAAAFVAAGAGARIAKHGNRSITRPSGSADVLERAGARLNLDGPATARVLDEVGIAFLFAPNFHPSMRHAAPVRRSLGGKTVFNLLGPLCNPAGAKTQVLGVYDPDLVPVMAEALGRLGGRGMVLHGLAGSAPASDEATPCGPVLVARVPGEDVELEQLHPHDHGISACTPDALAPVPAEQAPALVEAILAHAADGARQDAVLLNAALALEATGRAADLDDAMEMARGSMATGSGTAKWHAFIESTRRHG